MRWYILKTLLHKEALRHATNRGGLALAGLLVTASLLLATLNPAGKNDRQTQLIGGVQRCILHVDERAESLVKHLESHTPDSLRPHIFFQKLPSKKLTRQIQAPTGLTVFEVEYEPEHDGRPPRYKVWIWYPSNDRASIAAYEDWFWREFYRFLAKDGTDRLKSQHVEVERTLSTPDIDQDSLWLERQAFEQLRSRYCDAAGKNCAPFPELEFKEAPLIGSTLDIRAAIATALVMFSLFFTCVYLMPSLTCEERERGLLLAQALSPATALEILTAKFLFYPTFGILLATLLAGIHNPQVLTRPFFWLALFTLGVGSLGIGMTIASLAKTQRSASLGALCYMLVMALLLLICQQNNIFMLPWIAIEYHAPHILHGTLTNQHRDQLWLNLAASAVLAAGWLIAATIIFRKRGWQ